ncbi:hypothetical protein [Morganella phage Mecenats66]|nr:hypothetical protein [Morganella phage Mecenats66]
MYGNKIPYNQKAGVRPIAFLLKNEKSIIASVTLNIRPEDLAIVQPERVSVHQTLGREIAGWADDFGVGLPTISISGHTGWRTSFASGQDGADAWFTLKKIMREQYQEERQKMIDSGGDPSSVRLIYMDLLNQCTYSVIPQEFTLRRNKQKPLLFMYTMSLPAVDVYVDPVYSFEPWSGNTLGGLAALKDALGKLRELSDQVKGWINDATEFAQDIIAPVAEVVSEFVAMSNELFDIVDSTVNAGLNAIGTITNEIIGIGMGVAQVGINIGRTLATIENIPNEVMANFNRLSSAYNEIACILANSLKRKKIYDNYTGAYGASNCSSTSGGSPASLYSDVNLFEYIRPTDKPFTVTSDSMSAINGLSRADPVLSPIDVNTMSNTVMSINNGISFKEAA